jgi:hypothetical protein
MLADTVIHNGPGGVVQAVGDIRYLQAQLLVRKDRDIGLQQTDVRVEDLFLVVPVGLKLLDRSPSSGENLLTLGPAASDGRNLEIPQATARDIED